MNTTRINDLMRSMMHDIMKADQEAKLRKIAADPKGNKLTMLMGEGQNTNWRYWSAGKDGRGREIRFAYACHRNAAGYFLGWREIVNKDGTIKRDQFFARKVRKRASELQKKRAAAFKAKRAAKKPAETAPAEPQAEAAI